MYAITFELDFDALKGRFDGTLGDAHRQIREILVERHGFRWERASLYLGGERTDATACVLAASDLARTLPWFSHSVLAFQMLRIEEMDDLIPVVHQAAANP